MNVAQLILLRRGRVGDEIRHTHCLTWQQREQFGKLLVKVSSEISIVYFTALPEGLFPILSTALCEILVRKFSALGKKLPSRFVTNLKLSSAPSKCVKNFHGNMGCAAETAKTGSG